MGRFSWDPRKVKDVTYNARVAVSADTPIQQAPIRITVLGSWWAALLLVCTTMMVLASSFTAFILYVRPLLQVSDASSQYTSPFYFKSAARRKAGRLP